MKDTLKNKYLKTIRKTKISTKEIDNSERVLNTFNSALELFYNTKINKDSKIIDLGYGDGSFLKALEKNQIESKGYDFDTVNFENDEIPEASNSLDFITCNSVIEHLNDATNLLEEAFRILKPGGKLILITPNFFYDYENFYDDPTHINPFTIEKLKTILEINNFKNINILPWIVMKNPILWKIPFSFFFARYFLIARNDTRLPIPKFLKGKTKVMFSIAEKKI
tara:strand:+ start:895 stop:1566 length:672 start_codon:yes stop_codon:yes gene_type:complete